MSSGRRRRLSQPEFFVDFNLGKRLVADLRSRGLIVHTLESVYGAEGPYTPDVTWLTEAGSKGWTVLTKDKRIISQQLERGAIEAAKAKVFCLTVGTLRGQAQRDRILGHLQQIIRLSQRKAGPFVYGIYGSGVVIMWKGKR
jgi:predicted nuclease of predicted toxin-antitoxin system